MNQKERYTIRQAVLVRILDSDSMLVVILVPMVSMLQGFKAKPGKALTQMLSISLRASSQDSIPRKGVWGDLKIFLVIFFHSNGRMRGMGRL